jgi:hypothetical protein
MAQVILQNLRVADFVGPSLVDTAYAQSATGAFVAGRFTISSYVTAGESFNAELIGLSEVYSIVCMPADDQTGTAAQVVMRAVIAADRKSVLFKAYQALDGLQATAATNLGIWAFIAMGKRLAETEQISP